MDASRPLMLTLQVSLVLTVMAFGLRAAPADLLHLLRRPGLLVRSLVAVLVVMPLVAVVVSLIFELPRHVEVALLALSITPLPPLLTRDAVTAGRDRRYAVGLPILLGLVSIVVVRLAAQALGDQHLQTAAFDAVPTLAITVLVPLAFGLGMRQFWPAVAARLAAPVARLGTLLLVMGAVVLVVRAAPAVWTSVEDGTAVAMMVFVAIGLAVGHALGGGDLDHATVLALCTANRHPAIAFTLSAANFPDEHVAAVVLLYLVTAALGGIAYLAWVRRNAVGG